MSKTYFNAFNESEFYCITFRFYGHQGAPLRATGAVRAACVCVRVKMHSTQNVDKIVKTSHEVGQNRWQSRNVTQFFISPVKLLKVPNVVCVFLVFCLPCSPSLPSRQHALAKTTFPLAFCINSVATAAVAAGTRAGPTGGRKAAREATPKCMLDFWIFGLLLGSFWAFDYLCQIHLTRNLSYILEPRQGETETCLVPRQRQKLSAIKDHRFEDDMVAVVVAVAVHVACRSTQCQQNAHAARASTGPGLPRNNAATEYPSKLPAGPSGALLGSSDQLCSSAALQLTARLTSLWTHFCDPCPCIKYCICTKWICGEQEESERTRGVAGVEYWQGQSCIVGIAWPRLATCQHKTQAGPVPAAYRT